MCIKVDKNVWMNFLHSFFGGIFGGFAMIIFTGQSLVKGDLSFYVNSTLAVVIFGILGVLIMGHLNYRWEQGKKRIPKN